MQVQSQYTRHAHTSTYTDVYHIPDAHTQTKERERERQYHVSELARLTLVHDHCSQVRLLRLSQLFTTANTHTQRERK